MSFAHRIRPALRARRESTRARREMNRAIAGAATPAMRDELVIVAQRLNTFNR